MTLKGSMALITGASGGNGIDVRLAPGDACKEADMSPMVEQIYGTEAYQQLLRGVSPIDSV